MSNVAKISKTEAPEKQRPTGLDLLREPFPPNQISKLPKPTAKQTEEVKNDYKKGIRCAVCGGWHHPNVVHLDYVGHAALTDRLLDCDKTWNWEPVATDEHGVPTFDASGGMWIRLTVCGVTRLGYGHPDGKRGGDAIKETIGDALRNAAMRFGAALDLWHKGDLHGPDGDGEKEASVPQFDPAACRDRILAAINRRESKDDLTFLWGEEASALADLKAADQPKYREVFAAFKAAGEKLAKPAVDLGGDEIPY